MTGRPRLTADRVVAEAAALADERGIQALSLSPLAERLGVRVPSLYKHVGGLDDHAVRSEPGPAGHACFATNAATAGATSSTASACG